MDLLFLFPTTNELQAIYSSHKSGVIYEVSDFYCTCFGVGKQNIIPCEFPVVVGYGGALSPELKTGDIVVSSHFMHNDKEITCKKHTDFATQFVAHLNKEGICAYHQSVYTADRVIAAQSEKTRLYEKGAWVVDMEGFWLAEQSQDLLSIRVVLDTFAMRLPDLTHTLKANGEISLANTLKHLLKYPHHIVSLLKIFYLTKKIKPILKKCCFSLATFRRS
ncbi:hypothetical protein [Candidatus Uabimicrobium amorphum]|uniref:Nucleoside phosphorylase domain-containing protein n=1 Tax=Uabimicrobium amorphum TaxID=2596890 RepID=A0A5S9IUM1_UABAM|nr:hypothetical protein [Candidatus Uabimicrobium amorphum]BBM88047.1 hypothetical protein UABAM_06463 [Candidatus Uabimicrobium amorphum]